MNAVPGDAVQGLRPARPYPLVVIMLLVLATIACVLSAPETLNDGKGTRDKPVPAKKYALTTDYAVRVLSVVRDTQQSSTDEQNENSSELIPLRVQFQIRCEERRDDICRLEDIRDNIQLVDASGILYKPVYLVDVENPLAGDILGGGEKAGWLIYQIPRGVDITVAVTTYVDDQRVFFELP